MRRLALIPLAALLLAGCGGSGTKAAPFSAPTKTTAAPSPTPSPTPTPSQADVDRVFTNVIAATHILEHLDGASLSDTAAQYEEAATDIQRAATVAGQLQGIDTAGAASDALSTWGNNLTASATCLTNYLQEVSVNPDAVDPCSQSLDAGSPLASAAGSASSALLPYSSYTLEELRTKLAE